jgi:N-acetylglucosaminyl-diphospho-decaprenol L-rhamnosyltransferase
MPDAPSPDLSIIIVSWNVRELLRACLASLTKDERPKTKDRLSSSFVLRPSSVEIIVIDNASSDGSAAMVAAEFPQVRLISSADNRGFTGGNNQGIAAALGRYIFFLNPDTVVTGDALATMVGYMEEHPDVGVVGPQLRYGDGSLQSSRRRFPTFGSALFESTPLAWHWPDNPWARRYRMEDQVAGLRSQESKSRGRDEVAEDLPDSAGEDVDWLVGAALLTRRSVLDQVGGFDEGYFMYSEELDWCRRVKTAGWRVVYLPAAQIVHYEGKSSEQVVAARHIRFQTSKVRYFRKFHGRLAATALRTFLLAAFAAEWALETVKWLLGSKRLLRRERMAAYAQLLASGLRPN